MYQKMEKGDEELMEVAKELKNLTYDIDTIGLYDEEEERKRIENTKLINAEGKGASNEKKSIAKNLLKDGLPISKVCKYTDLSKKQISMLM